MSSEEVAASDEVVGELEVQLSVIDAIDHGPVGTMLKVEDDQMETDEVACQPDEADDQQTDNDAEVDALMSDSQPHKIKGVQYPQRYRAEWEQEEFCKLWISPYPQNEFMAWCKACKRNLHARKNDLLKHNASQRHQENMETYQQTGTPAGDVGKKYKTAYMFNAKFLEHAKLRDWLCPVANAPNRSWCCLCACFLAPQLSGLLMHAKSMKHRRNSKRRPVEPPDSLTDGSLETSSGGGGDARKSLPAPPVADTSVGDGERTPRRYNKRIRKPKRPWTPTEENRLDETVASGGVASTPVAISLVASGDDTAELSESDEECSPPLPTDTDFADRVTLAIGLGGRKVGFLGSGQLAQSMAQGMMHQGLISPLDILVSAPSGRHMAPWRGWQCSVLHDNDALLAQADIVVLAVKASVLGRLIDALRPVADSRLRLFISVVPGVTRQRVHELLTTRIVPVQLEESCAADPQSPPPPSSPAAAADGTVAAPPAAAPVSVQYTSLHVVRCAPNKMMALGAGFCAFCMGSDLPHTLHLAVETIFSSLGTCVEVDESLMDAYTTTIGCGAAFTCAFIEALVQGTVSLDVPWDEALKACACVVQGAAKMVLQSGRQPAELRRAICTPGGSTIAGVAALQRGGLDDTVVSAMELACRKTSSSGSTV